MKYLTILFVVCLSLISFSNAYGTYFQQNRDLVKSLKENNLKIIVLCSFQGLNNALNIVTSSCSPGYDLTAEGLSDLQNTAAILETQNISLIYTAPAFRAMQTANFLGKAYHLTPAQLITDPRLKMQNFGDAEGYDYNLYKDLYLSPRDMLENTPPNGESGYSVFNRMESFLQSLTTKRDQTILVVTHAFNYCHISKCLTGKYQSIPATGTYKIYDFTTSN